MSLGWAQKAVTGEKEAEEAGEEKSTLARLRKDGGEGSAPQGPECRALAGRAQATRIRGSARSFRGKRGSRARLGRPPPPGSSGFPSGVRGWGERRPRALPAPPPPGRLGSQRSGRAPPGRGRRAQSWPAGTATSARRILCCAPLGSGGSPGPAAPGPAASIQPQPPAQREIKPPPIPLHAFGETFPAAAGRGTSGRGRARGRPSPYRPPAAARAATSRLLRLPLRGSPRPSAPPRPPRR